MIGRNSLKRAVKGAAGRAAILARLLAAPSATDSACVFYYHRVARLGFVDSQVDDWNVTPEMFERQIAALSEFAEIVPLLELPRRLLEGETRSKPLVCLTFDDGYASFYTEALPVLKRYGAPATAFIVTGSIGQNEPMEFDEWSQKNRGRTPQESWRAMSWEELEACVASGLVEIGAHGHRHLRGSRCDPSQLREEAEESRATLLSRLGDGHARAYAYPYGSSRLRDVSSEYVEAARAAGYRLAVTTDLGMASAKSDPFRLPRIEAHALDVPGVLKAKATGALAPYRLTDHFRLLSRTV